jgi:ribosomal protein S18 acetylase RimI-like enzyme
LPEQPGPIVRPAREEDARAVAEAIYLTSPEGFDLFGGRGERALRLIEAAFDKPGSDCSREVVTVAELDGEVAGAMSAFPAEEGDARRRTFLRLALRRRPPWRWWRVVRVARHGASHSPTPPAGSLYIDSLATAERFRRRGVAAALLDEAERVARERGLTAVSLDTRSSNSAARALYEGRGYDVHVQVAASRPIPALVGYVKRLG